jgi:hypothetical protein
LICLNQFENFLALTCNKDQGKKRMTRPASLGEILAGEVGELDIIPAEPARQLSAPATGSMIRAECPPSRMR